MLTIKINYFESAMTQRALCYFSAFGLYFVRVVTRFVSDWKTIQKLDQFTFDVCLHIRQ